MADTSEDGSKPTPGAKVGAVNIIRLTQLQEDDVPVVALCPYCQADLSAVCLGAYMGPPGAVEVVCWHPLRCPECHHPLLYMSRRRRVLRPPGAMG